MRIRYGELSLAIGISAACGTKPEAPPPADSAGAMAGMAMQGMQMMPGMQAHLDSMAVMTPERMAGMMAAHQDQASRMMDAMGADMRGMNMQPDSVWTAVSDSLRRDLAELPGLSGGPLGLRMEAHIARMRRMMAMHQGMMKM
jgi:hypothetical protein